MKKSILKTSLFLVFLISCNIPDEVEESNKIAYYNFKSTDLDKLLPYTENQQLIFKNQMGDERIFQVKRVSKYFKNSYTVGMGFFTSYAAKYFDYDKKNIFFHNELAGEFEINFIRWPNNTELAESNIYYEYPSSFSAYIDSFPYWNGLSNENVPSSYIKIDYSLIKTTMAINGTIYNDVLKFVSNNNASLPSSNPNCPKNVNVIYYDAKKGIIGFDDLDNKNWRLQ